MVVGEPKRSIMDGIENTGDVRLHDHRLRLKQRFDIIRKLGQGTYGKVQLGINKKTGQEVAIKTIKKCKIETEADLVRIRREVQIMSSVRHPNIVHIYEVFENSEKMILVMEYCAGGELYDYLSQQKVLKENEARRLFRQIATACYYCHKHKICHRDLKLENVLLDEHGSAKIADFGLSNVFEERRLLSTFCGSPLYASPEIVKGTPYIGPEVDCWSLGVLLYTLVYGAMPFDGSNFKRLVKQISTGDYFEPKTPSSASPLIRDMLTVDPIQRADITHICDHPWVNKGSDVSCLELAESLANETPVRLDLLLSLAPAPAHGSDKLVVTDEVNNTGVNASPTRSMSMASIDNSAERRILEMVAEGGTDAIKPSPTRTIVSAADQPKRKLETTVSMDNAPSQRKKERSVRSTSKTRQTPPQNDSNESATPPNANSVQTSPVTGDISIENQKRSPPAEVPQDTVSSKPQLEVNESLPSGVAENHTALPNNETSTAVNRVSPSSPNKTLPVSAVAKKDVKPKDPVLKEKNLPSKPTVAVKKKLNPNISKTSENKSTAVKEKSPPRKSTEKDATSPLNNCENKSPPRESGVNNQTANVKHPQPTERRKSRILDAAEKLNNLTIQPSPPPPPAAEAVAQNPPVAKPKRVIVPGVSVGSFKEQFERRASLTSSNIPSATSEAKKPAVKSPQGNVTSQPPIPKTLVDKKMHSVDSEHPLKENETKDSVNVRLQSIGVEPSPQVKDNAIRPTTEKPTIIPDMNRKVTKPLIKSESLKEPSSKQETLQSSLSLEDARRSLQQSMALINQAKGDYGSLEGIENGSPTDRQSQLKTAREIISNAIGDDSNGKKVHRICMGGKPPVPYGSGGRTASGSISLSSLPSPSPPTSPPHSLHRSVTRESPVRTYRTEVQHRVDDVRNKFIPTSRGGSVERIIPIHIADEAPKPQNSFKTHTPQLPYQRNNTMPYRLGSIPRTTPDLDGERTSQPMTPTTPAGLSRAEPIKKSPREFIIPIAVEGVGYVTPRQGSLEPSETPTKLTPSNIGFASRFPKPRRLTSLASGGESEDEDDMQMHRLRSSRRNPADAEKESVSSGEEDDDEGFVLLTAENLFSTLLDRVRDLTNRLNGEEGTGFPQHHQSLFNNLHSPFFNSPHLPRKHKRHNVMREGPSWRRSGTRDITSDFDSMFPTHTNFPRGSKKSSRRAAKDRSESSRNDSVESSKSNNGSGDAADGIHLNDLDLSDLDLSKIELSEKEMETLSGLTPALSRRLQRQLLARLPPAAARTLRRTLSANCPLPDDTLRPRRDYARSLSSAQSADRASEIAPFLKRDGSDVSLGTENQIENNILPVDETKDVSNAEFPVSKGNDSILTSLGKKSNHKSIQNNSNADLFSLDKTFDSLDLGTEKSISTSNGGSVTPRRASSVHSSTPDRSVLSKYFSPERTPLGDRSFLGNGSDVGDSIVESDYLGTYGGPSDTTGGLLRRRSLRTPPAEAPVRRRVSRFLRPDFFDTPREESVYVRDKKDREMETQKILKEIREKKSKMNDQSDGGRSRSSSFARLSPADSYASRDVSRSVTPFFLALDDIHESHDDTNSRTELQRALMAIGKQLDESNSIHSDDRENLKQNGTSEIETFSNNGNTGTGRESRIARPKSFPSKPADSLAIFKDLENNNSNVPSQPDTLENNVSERETKIIRPKSYPVSSPDKTPDNISSYTVVADKQTIDSADCQQLQTDLENFNNNASPVKDDNGNITVTFSINLPKKTNKPLNLEEKVIDNATKMDEKKKNSPKKKKIIVKKKPVSLKNVTSATDNSDKPTKDDINTDVTLAEPSPPKTEEPKSSPARKKSVLSSIGEKFEKFRIDSFTKSSSQEKESAPDKLPKQSTPEVKEEKAKVSRIENVMRVLRERSVPTSDRSEPITESGLIKRAVTITDLPTLETKDSQSKKGVNRVLGLFKKIESKDKLSKPDVPSVDKEAVNQDTNVELASNNPPTVVPESPAVESKPKRPTSLLLNGIGKRVQACYSGATSDSIINKSEKKSAKADESTESTVAKGEDVKSHKKGLRLDFSRLPRLNQGIFNKRNSLDTSKSREGSVSKEVTESQEIHSKETEESDNASGAVVVENGSEDCLHDFKNVSAPLISPNWSPDCDTSKFMVEQSDTPTSPGGTQHPQRTHEGTSPDPENIVDRIRRKSFYSRFNEKKNRRKSLLVGPGAKEYIPSARIHSHSDVDAPSHSKYDSSPTSPLKYATSPLSSDHARTFQPSDRIECLSPSTSRLRSIVNNDTLSSTGNKSLERYESRYLPEAKYSETASHYSIPRYTRTVSLFDNFDGRSAGESKISSSRYGRTLSQLSPGNYATYSPRTHSRNSAILLRENGDDTEMSRDSILAKIRSRKSPATVNTAIDDDVILDSKLRSNSSQPSEHDLPVDKVE